MIKRNEKLKRLIACAEICCSLGTVNSLTSVTVAAGIVNNQYEYNITFTVADSQGNALRNAKVEIDENTYMTDSNGEVNVGVNSPKNYIYTVNSNGYKNITNSVEVRSKNSTVEVVLRKTEESEQIPTVPNITGYVENQEYDHSMTDKDITLQVGNSSADSRIAYYEYIMTDIDAEGTSEEDWNSSKKIDNNTNNLISIIINGNKEKKYWFRAVTKDGINGYEKSYIIRVERKYTDIKINNGNEKEWYTALPSIEVNKLYTEGLKTSYRISKKKDGGYKYTNDFQEITEENKPQITEDGQYLLEILTSDPEEEKELIKKKINIDTTAPKGVDIKYNDEDKDNIINDISKCIFFKDTLNIKIYCEDDLSGIKEIKYHINNNGSSQSYTSNDFITNEDKKYIEINIRPKYKGTVVIDSIEDNAGNKLNINATSPNIVSDTSIPTQPKIMTSTEEGIYKGEWTKNDVNIKIEGSKADSGIKGYKVIAKKSNESAPTESEWSQIADSELYGENNANNIDELITNNVKAEINVTEDTNCKYYIRATSNAGTDGIIEEVQVKVQKTVPNVVSVKIPGANEDGWINNNDKIEIATIDDSDGIGIKTYYKIFKDNQSEEDVNAIQYNGYNTPDISKDGKYTLKVWNEDEAGNKSDEVVNKFNIDRTKPAVEESEIQYNENAVKKFLNDLTGGLLFEDYVRVRIYAKDNLSDIKEIAYYIKDDNGNNDIKRVTKDDDKDYIEFEIKNSFKGNIVLYSITDKAGNENVVDNSKYGVNKITVDSVAPTKPKITATVDNSTYNGNWTNKDIQIKVSGSEAISGIKEYQYVLNSGSTPNESDWNNCIHVKAENENTLLKTINSDENGTYWIRAVSNVGKVSEVNSIKVKEKKTAPENAKLINNIENNSWKNNIEDLGISRPSDTDIKIYTYYKIWNKTLGQNENSVEKVLFNGLNEPKLNSDGEYEIKIWTEDEAGNKSKDVISKTVNIDMQAPKNFRIQYNDNNIQTFINNTLNYQIFKDSVKVKIYSEDDLSGIASIMYRLEDNSKIYGATEVNKDNNGYYVEFNIASQYKGKIILESVADRAGNVTTLNKNNTTITNDEGIQNVIVDGNKPTIPQINAYTSDGVGYNGFWTNKNVFINVGGSYALSDIKEYKYILTDGNMPNENEWDNALIFNGGIGFGEDINKTLWVRAISNAGIEGEIASYPIKVKKTSPQNAQIFSDNPNNEGWYNSIPIIKINPYIPEDIGVKTYYKIWNEKNGENEDTAEIKELEINGQPSVNSDGEYKMIVWTVDEAGNRSINDVTGEYKVDMTAPTVTMNYDNNNSSNEKYYNSNRNATIKISETNFNANKVSVKVNGSETNNGWIDNGNGVYSSNLSFDTDGVYTVSVSCTDKADNQGNTINDQEFVIDKTVPNLEITNIQDLSANKEPVAPEITCNDTNIDLSNVTYKLEGSQNGEKKTDENIIDNNTSKTIKFNTIDTDDNYTLTALATDKAGNKVEKKVSFSVNQNGSVITFLSGDINKKYINKAFTPAIKIDNVDAVNINSLTLNGENVAYTFKDGIVEFNNEIRIDGKYIINLEVQDAAGNINEMEPIEFILDTTDPKITIDGVEDGEVYDSQRDITIRKDQESDTFEYIKLNGEKLKDSDYEIDNGVIKLTVKELGEYSLEVKVKDKAENETIKEVNFNIANVKKGSILWIVAAIIAAFVAVLGAAKLRIFSKKN